MKTDPEVRLGTLKCWGRHVMRELASASAFVARGLEMQDETPTIADIRALAEPHMPVLLHKRAKAGGGGLLDAMDDKRWTEELQRHAAQWAGADQSRGTLAAFVTLLDRVVAEEQTRLAEVARMEPMPMTSRFDTSWAI